MLFGRSWIDGTNPRSFWKTETIALAKKVRRTIYASLTKFAVTPDLHMFSDLLHLSNIYDPLIKVQHKMRREVY